MKICLLILLLLGLQNTLCSKEQFYWNGTIAKSPVRLFLTTPAYPGDYTPYSAADTLFYARHKNSIRGMYYYNKFRKGLSIIGSKEGKSWNFEEFKIAVCINCSPNGFITGKELNDTLIGSWYSADSSIKHPIYLTKHPLNKKTILSWLKGKTWSLSNGDGFAGANTMTQFGKDEKGEWYADGSSIYQGMRQGFGFDLSKSEKKLLNNLKIQITDSLDFILKLGSKVLYKLPYNSEPVFNLSTIDPESDDLWRVHELKNIPTLNENLTLNFGLVESPLFDKLFVVEALSLLPPSVLHIEYHINGDKFSIRSLSAQFVDNQSLIFERIK